MTDIFEIHDEPEPLSVRIFRLAVKSLLACLSAAMMTAFMWAISLGNFPIAVLSLLGALVAFAGYVSVERDQ